jgi:hypothetical protein
MTVNLTIEELRRLYYALAYREPSTDKLLLKLEAAIAAEEKRKLR